MALYSQEWNLLWNIDECKFYHPLTKTKSYLKKMKTWYLDLHNVAMNIGITNKVISSQQYHNTTWNIISKQEEPSTTFWAHFVPSEFVTQLEFEERLQWFHFYWN